MNASGQELRPHPMDRRLCWMCHGWKVVWMKLFETDDGVGDWAADVECPHCRGCGREPPEAFVERGEIPELANSEAVNPEET